MPKGYILEIKTSSSPSGCEGGQGVARYGNDTHNSNNSSKRSNDDKADSCNSKLKEQFKGISNKDNDLSLSMDGKVRSTSGTNTNGTTLLATTKKSKKSTSMSKRHHGKGSSTSHSLDKYIKFTVKKSDHCNDEILNRVGKFMVIFLSIGLFWHVLNKFDPVGKSIGGEVRMRELNEAIVSECYRITNMENNTPDDNIVANMNPIDRIRYKNETNSLLLIIEKMFNGLKMNREEYLLQDLISLVYLGISVFAINEIYWRVYHDIEESLVIIPHLGVQTESILIKENIWGVLKKVLGLSNIYGGNTGEERKEKGIVINKQFVTMDYVKDIVINEGFKGFEVVFYMTLIMEDGVMINNGEDSAGSGADHEAKLKMIVVFPNLLPRRAILETVFRKSREYIRK